MKKILLLMLLISPFLAVAQGKVYNKSNTLVYKYDGKYLYHENTKVGTWEIVSYIDNEIVYRRTNKIGQEPQDKMFLYFNGREICDAKTPNMPMFIFDGKYLYMGTESNMSAAIGCFVDNCYYRGTEPNPDKLVFKIDGEVPIAMLLFANMAK
jgi:hypothetical protein